MSSKGTEIMDCIIKMTRYKAPTSLLVPNLTMIICKWLVRTNNMMKISVHQFINNVHIIEGLLFWWSYDVLDGNNL